MAAVQDRNSYDSSEVAAAGAEWLNAACYFSDLRRLDKDFFSTSWTSWSFSLSFSSITAAVMFSAWEAICPAWYFFSPGLVLLVLVLPLAFVTAIIEVSSYVHTRNVVIEPAQCRDADQIPVCGGYGPFTFCSKFHSLPTTRNALDRFWPGGQRDKGLTDSLNTI